MNMLIKEIAKKQFAKVYWYLILGINKVFLWRTLSQPQQGSDPAHQALRRGQHLTQLASHAEGGKPMLTGASSL